MSIIPKNKNVYNFVKDSPQEDISSFLELRNCDNTRETYLRHYQNVFWEICRKEISSLTWSDITNITMKMVKDFRVGLLKQGFKPSTINQRVFATKKLWQEFRENGRVTENVFDIEELTEKDNPYDSLTEREMDRFLDYCLSLKHKPLTQYLYFKFLYVVSCRKHVAQNLTWSDIVKDKDEFEQEFWVVCFESKGKMIKKAITDQFYDQLWQNYRKCKEFSGKVFNVHDNTLKKTLKDFCKLNGITRKIAQHSIRSTSSDHIQRILGDVNITAKALGHKNIQTTYNKYMNKNNDYSNQPSFMLDREFSVDELRSLNEEELLQLINKSGNEVLAKLCIELEKNNKLKKGVIGKVFSNGV